jgi:hypothetical protein
MAEPPGSLRFISMAALFAAGVTLQEICQTRMALRLVKFRVQERVPSVKMMCVFVHLQPGRARISDAGVANRNRMGPVHRTNRVRKICGRAVAVRSPAMAAGRTQATDGLAQPPALNLDNAGKLL